MEVTPRPWTASDSVQTWTTTMTAAATTYNLTTGEEDELIGGCRSNEESTEEPTETPGCVLYSFIVYTVVIGLLGLFGTVGNLLSFLVFYRDKIKTSTSFLFQVLSVIDTLMLITVFPMFSMPKLVAYTGWYSTYQDFAYQLVLVHLLPFIFIVQTSTIWVTVLVGINRYIAVCMPYQAVRLCTVAQAKRQLAIVLLLAVAYNAPKFAEGRLQSTVGPSSSWVVCAVHTSLMDNRLYLIVYGNISYTVFMLVVPLLTLSVLNVRLMAALKDVNRKRREMQSARQQADNNVTLVLIVVVIVFSVCQFPALVTQLSWNFLPDEARLCGGFQFYFSHISNALVVANSAVNFAIYFRFNNRFRTILSQQVCCRRRDATAAAVAGAAKRHPLLMPLPADVQRRSAPTQMLAAADGLVAAKLTAVGGGGVEAATMSTRLSATTSIGATTCVNATESVALPASL